MIVLFAGASVKTSSDPTVESFPARITVVTVILSILVAGVWFSMSYFPVQSFDYFYHLATGRWIAEHASVPTTDMFSHTAQGDPWVTHEWGAQLLFYLGSQAVGVSGMVMVKALCMTLTGLLLFWTGIRLRCPAGWTAVISAAVVFMVTFRAFLRPHLITYFFLVLLMTLLATVPDILHRRIRWLFPVIFLLWANQHSGFVFGLFVLTVWLLTGFPGKPRGPSQGIRFATLLGACFAAGLVNPNFWHVYLYPFAFFVNPVYFQVINELQPVTAPAFRGAVFIPIFWIYLTLCLTVFLLNWKQKPFRDLIFLAVFGYLSITSVRNVPLAALICAPGLMHHSGFLFWRVNGTHRRVKFLSSPVFQRIISVLIVAGLIGLCAWPIVADVPMSASGSRSFGGGLKNLNYPDGAIEFLKTNPLKGEMFNSFAFGGYLLWKQVPDPRVFIDGRLFLYQGEIFDVYSDAIRGTLTPNEIARRFNVSHFILNYPDGDPLPGLYKNLLSNPEWPIVYWDDNTLVFARNQADNHGVVMAHAYRYINPLKRTMSAMDRQIRDNPMGVKAEAERNLSLNPRCSGARVILGRAATLESRWEDAADHYMKALETSPPMYLIQKERARAMVNSDQIKPALTLLNDLHSDHPGDDELMMYLGLAYYLEKNSEKAETWYLKAYRTNPRNYYVLNSLGILYAEQNRLDDAEKFWKKALHVNSTSGEARRNLERLYRMRETLD